MRFGRRPHHPPVRAPPLCGLHVRRGGHRRYGRRRRASLQRRDGTGPHGLWPGDAGTTRAQRRPRTAPDEAPPARRPNARRSEGRGAFAVRALRGRRHAGRTHRSGAAGHRRPRPRVRALGREGVPRQTRRRRHPPRSTRRRCGERRRSRNRPPRGRTRVDGRAKGAGVRPCRGRCLRSSGTRRALRARRRGRMGDRAGP